ncbi:peptidase C14, caspase [Desulfosarcina variabilis str. Montpellier]|uniref:caspase family protein n=1 Tax=Desulfosarcina variabilis TaxID=2300 RepID=UPI003AFA38BE
MHIKSSIYLLSFNFFILSIIFSTFVFADESPFPVERGLSINNVFNQKKRKRIALVIGNKDYLSSPLKNPINDASDIAEVLRDCEFRVHLFLNATKKEMEESIQDFGQELRKSKGGIGFFYFAGHGIQYKGINFLIPIDEKIISEADIEFEAVNANRVLIQMQEARNSLNMVFLDACRNNPYANSFRSTVKGLARMNAPKGSLVSYATAPFSVAYDGHGRNGIYTKHLIDKMRMPNVELSQMMKLIRAGVMKDTKGKQTPFEVSSLIGNFYFKTTEDYNINSVSMIENTLESLNDYSMHSSEGIIYDNDEKKLWLFLDKNLRLNYKKASFHVEGINRLKKKWRIPTYQEIYNFYQKIKSSDLFFEFALNGIYWTSSIEGKNRILFNFDTGNLFKSYSFNKFFCIAVTDY